MVPSNDAIIGTEEPKKPCISCSRTLRSVSTGLCSGHSHVVSHIVSECCPSIN